MRPMTRDEAYLINQTPNERMDHDPELDAQLENDSRHEALMQLLASMNEEPEPEVRGDEYYESRDPTLDPALIEQLMKRSGDYY